MKWFPLATAGLLATALLAAGCTRETKTTEGEGGRKLTLRGPSDTSLKPDGTAAITVDITREKFNDPVALTFSGLPDGVTVMESDRTISKDATTAKLTLKAAAGAAAVSDHKVTVTAAGGGMKEDVGFKVTVTAADNAKKLTLSGPSDTSVRQDGTATIDIGITRDKFNAPVALTFAGLPAGVAVMEDDRAISKDATSAKLTLKAAADAPPMDDHKVTVTATGGGLTQEATFKVTVKKKG